MFQQVMKLFLRLSKPVKRTVTVTLADVDAKQPCLKDLMSLAAQTIGLKPEEQEAESVAIKLSLNNKDFLLGDSTPLSDLGIVNGDLIYVHVPENTSLQTADQAATSCQPSCKQQDHHEIGKTQSNSQMELSPTTSSPNNTICSQLDGLTASLECTSSDQSTSFKDNQKTGKQGISDVDTGDGSECIKQVLLIQDSNGDHYPQMLRIMLEMTQSVTEHQVIFLVLHVLTLETGFVLQDAESQLFPNHKAAGQLKLDYKCRGSTEKGFSLVAVPMASKLLFSAISYGADKVRYSHVLKPADYVILSDNAECYSEKMSIYDVLQKQLLPKSETSHSQFTVNWRSLNFVLQTHSIRPKFRNLSQLSSEVKSKVLYMMLQHLASDEPERSQHASDLALIGVEEMNRCEINRYLKQAILVRDSNGDDPPQSLRLVLETAQPVTEHEALFLVIHVLVLETGFILQHPEQCLLPDKEKCSRFELTYRCRGEIEKGFSLVAVMMANKLLVHAVSQDTDAIRYNIALKSAEYVKLSNSGIKFKKLAQLSREVKDKVSYPMLQYLTNETDIYVPSLVGLLYEIQILILKSLDVPSLLRLSETCQLYNELCKSPMLWQRLFIKDFGKFKAANKDSRSDWFQLYKEQYLLRKKLRDHLRRTCSVFPYNGDRPSLRPPFIRPPGWMPPFMIGGDYDRLPGSPFTDSMGCMVDQEPARLHLHGTPQSDLLPRSGLPLASHHRHSPAGRINGRPAGLGRLFHM